MNSIIRPSIKKILASLLAVLMVATSLLVVMPPIEVGAANIVITLDPGHGGKDPGATGASAFGGMTEAQYVLIFCNYMKERLEQYGGFTVYLTRTNDTFIELSTRPTIAKNHGSDAFISVHCNSAASSAAKGSEVYTAQAGASNYTASQNMASIVLSKLVAATGNSNRGVKTASYAVLNGAKNKGIPVGILIETGFVVNQGDYNRTFATDAIRKKVAYAMADGIAQYYGKTGAPAAPSAPASPLVRVSNDELRYLAADGNQIGQAFTPGQYDAWSKTAHITTDAVKTLVDWGWAAFNANSYQYGYIVNGREIFSNSFTAATEDPVKSAISASGASNGSRFMGTLSTSELNPGNNSVKFCVKLNGNQNIVLRDYTVVVMDPNLVYVANDHNAIVNSAGQMLAYPFSGGGYDSWNKKISLRADIADHLDDYGWVAMKDISSYQFGYIINNSTEIFKDSFVAPTEDAVKNVCAANFPGTTPSRFCAALPLSALSVGSNNVKLCVRMNGTFTSVIREYTVELKQPSVLDAPNDELRLLDASGNQVGQAYTPGEYNSWNKNVSIDKATVKSLADWGWVAVDADSFDFGYIINGTQHFGIDYKYPTGDDVNAAIASHGVGVIGSRYLTSLSTSLLNVGANSVKFCVRLNGTTIVTLREYSVSVTDSAASPEATPPPEITLPDNQTPPASDVDPAIPLEIFTPDKLVNVEIDPNSHNGVLGAVVNKGSYVTITPFDGDPYYYLGKNIAGSRYIAVKYRTPASCNGMTLQVYLDSVSGGPRDDSNMLYGILVGDGEWHTLVFDTKPLMDTGAYNGEFLAHLRLDPLEAGYMLDGSGNPIYDQATQTYPRVDLPAGATIDVAYVALCHAPNTMELYEANNNGSAGGETNPPASGETNPPTSGETNPPAGGETNTPNENETNASNEDETNLPLENDTEAPVEDTTTSSETASANADGTLDPDETQADSDPEDLTGSELKGCASALASSAVFVVFSALAGMVCLKKKKED